MPHLLFLFNFAMDDPLRRAFDEVADYGVKFLTNPIGDDLDYADKVILYGDNPQVIQKALNNLSA